VTRGAHASTRVTVTAMAIGEAVGIAAVMTMKGGTSVQEINGEKVREELTKVNGGTFTA